MPAVCLHGCECLLHGRECIAGLPVVLRLR